MLALFTGYELVEPGLVTISTWRPNEDPISEHDTRRDGLYAGVGRNG
ncbi:SAM-dependent methyltransferase [Lentzea sp. NPDC042327]